MTICIATDGFVPGTSGIATFNRHLSTLLTRAGHKVVILLADYDASEGASDTIKSEGQITIVKLCTGFQKHMSYWRNFFRHGGIDVASWIATGMAMKEWMERNHTEFGIDIVEVSDYGGLGIFLSQPTLPPVVITGHGSLEQLSSYQFPEQDEQIRLMRKLENLSYRYGNAIIAHSLFNKEMLEKMIGRDVSLSLIPWQQNKNAVVNTIHTNECIVIGGLQPVKGIYEMLETARILLKTNSQINIAWIGPDTWLAPGYRQMSVYLEKEYAEVWGKNFQWKGSMSSEDIMEAIARSSLVILPSTFDTFGYSAIEAASAGKAIILTKNVGASYLFTHGKDALIIPSNEPELLVKSIRQLNEQAELRSQFGQQAQMMVKERLREEVIIKDRLRIYAETRSKPAAHPEACAVLAGLLRPYRHPIRKYYYIVRAKLKKLLGRG